MRNLATLWKRFCRHRLAVICLFVLLTLVLLKPLYRICSKVLGQAET